MRSHFALPVLGALLVLFFALPSFAHTTSRAGDPVKPVPWKSR